MIQGLHAAANGLMAIEQRQSVIANNLANISTPGFRRQDGVLEGFNQILLGKMGSAAQYKSTKGPGGGVEMLETYTDLRNGTVVTTGNPMDVALNGPGFFAIQTTQGERFTRSGNFTVDPDGDLATVEGHKVSGETGGPVNVAGGQVEFDQNGNVYVNGDLIDRLRVVEFLNPRGLTREGLTLYASNNPDIVAGEPVETEIVPGSLEMSNVQAPIEVANMMIALRAYAANQKVINSADETIGRLIDQVAMPL